MQHMALLDETAGAVFIGSFVSAIMFGVTVTQAIHYYQNFPKDIRFFKLAVTLLVILDFAHVTLVAQGAYIYCVKSIANPELLQLVPIAFPVQNIVTVLSITTVRCTFTRRIWFLSDKNRVVTGFLLLMTAAASAASLAADIAAFNFRTFEQFSKTSWVVYGSFSVGIMADVFITSSLSFFLYRSSRGFERTSTLLNALILYVVGTGLITIIGETLMIILYATSRNTLLFLTVFLSFSKLYINSLFASLNRRPSLQRSGEPSHYGSSEGSRPQRLRIPSVRSDSSRYDLGELEFSSSSKGISLEVGPAGENSVEQTFD